MTDSLWHLVDSNICTSCVHDCLTVSCMKDEGVVSYQAVVQSPALVTGSGIEAVVPVGVTCDIRILLSPCICEASTYQQLAEGVSFFLCNNRVSQCSVCATIARTVGFAINHPQLAGLLSLMLWCISGMR